MAWVFANAQALFEEYRLFTNEEKAIILQKFMLSAREQPSVSEFQVAYLAGRNIPGSRRCIYECSAINLWENCCEMQVCPERIFVAAETSLRILQNPNQLEPPVHNHNVGLIMGDLCTTWNWNDVKGFYAFDTA